MVKQILASRPMEVVPIPSLDSFLSDSEMAHDYRFQGTFDELKDKTFVVLHTSGSTGIPKPVFVTHGTFASNDAHQLIPSLGGRPTFVDYARGKRLFISMPLFHAANIGMVACAIFSGFTCVLPPPGPLAAGTVDMIHTYGIVHGSLFPPSMVVDIYNHPDYLENMIQRLDFVAYVGGTLTAEIGDHFSRKMKLITLFGTTENMYFPLEIHDKPVDWQYMKFSPFLGHIFRPWKDGLDELVVLRNEEKSAFQGIFSTFPKINEYATKDLYERHPAREDFWRFSGRSDDIICFNNAEKLNPITMEAIISSHPGVNSAIIGGNGQFQASLLIEPRTYPADFTEEQRLIDEIWPTIVKANRDCPAHGRIMRDFVMLADLERPIPKAGKTTVQRYATLQMYASEFEAIYKKRTHSSPQVIESTRTSHSTKEETALPDTRNEASELDVEAASKPTSSELDVRIEGALHRILPNVLAELFGLMAKQMASNMFRPPQMQNTLMESADAYPNSSKDIRPQDQSAERHDCQPSALGKSALIQDNGASANGASVDGSTSLGDNSPSGQTYQTAKQSLHQALSTSMYLQDISDEADLFEHGLDSIQMTSLVREINAFLGKSRPEAGPIQPQTVYENRSIASLVKVLEAVV